MKSKPFIHPNCPKKLAAAFHFARNTRGQGYKIHILAEKLGVNVRYLHNMIAKGIEPNDTTEKLREVRVKMFLPAKKRKAKHEREFDKAIEKIFKPTPEHVKWWKKLPKEQRDEWIQRAHKAREYYNPANLPK